MIEEAWKDYEAKVIPPGAPQVQRIESRRAFYAGAKGFLDGLLAGLGVGDEPTAPDMAIMDACVAELQAFWVAVREGRA
jgi:hypothetical protein